MRDKNNAYGFQCHMEITSEGISALVDAVPADLAPSQVTRTRQELVSADYASINQMMRQILERFAAL